MMPTRLSSASKDCRKEAFRILLINCIIVLALVGLLSWLGNLSMSLGRKVKNILDVVVLRVRMVSYRAQQGTTSRVAIPSAALSATVIEGGWTALARIAQQIDDGLSETYGISAQHDRGIRQLDHKLPIARDRLRTNLLRGVFRTEAQIASLLFEPDAAAVDPGDIEQIVHQAT
jgi:hypothetical protein